MTEFRHNGDGSVTVLRDGYPPSHTAYFAPDQWQAVEEHVLRGAIRRVREDVARRTPLEVPEVEDEADDGYVLNPVERFWSHTEREGDCLIWMKSVRPNGYGEVAWEGRTMLAHRVAWLITHGSLPDLPLDHLADRCSSRACVNPDHLEPVTQAENNRRANARRNYESGRTICPRGHDLTDPANAYPRPGRKSGVACRACNRLHQANYSRRQAGVR